MASTPNIWSDEWEFESDEEWAAGARMCPVGGATSAPPTRRSDLTFTQPYIFPNTTCGVTLHRTRSAPVPRTCRSPAP